MKSPPLLVCCVLCVVYLCSAAHGQIAGDPAPGRSPGPPSAAAPENVGGLAASAASVEDNETIERGAAAVVAAAASIGPPAEPQPHSGSSATAASSCAQWASAGYMRRSEADAGGRRTSDDENAVRLAVVHDVFDVAQGLVNQIVYTVRVQLAPSTTVAALADVYVEAFFPDDRSPAGRFFDAPEIDDIRSTTAASDDAAAAGDETSSTTTRQRRRPWRCARCECANVWTERSGRDTAAELSRKWFVNVANRQNKTVKFRLMYRKVTSSAVFETVYTHHLLEDCNLTLLHPSASLDYTHMPLYNDYENCTVFFPSRRPHDFQHNHILNTTPTTTSVDANADGDDDGGGGSTAVDAIADGGLIVQLTRLNVPCTNTFNTTTTSQHMGDGGGGGSSSAHLAFATTNATATKHTSITTTRPICGKLEDLPPAERTRFFPLGHRTRLQLRRHPSFRLRYDLVDSCYNVSFRRRNGSYYLRPRDTVNCTFAVHLPYGNRIRLRVLENGGDDEGGGGVKGANDDVAEELLELSSGAHFRQPAFAADDYFEAGGGDSEVGGAEERERRCADGVQLQIIDPLSSFRWADCIRAGGRRRRLAVVSTGNRLVIRVRQREPIREMDATVTPAASLFFAYEALPEARIVGGCAFGWIAVQQLCVTAVEEAAVTWPAAELECKRRGGNLAVVRNEREQRLIDVMLLAGATAERRGVAYWVGATDRAVEGEFRWSSGYPFGFSNWFPGWPEFNHYNKQPNDDGLSGQDCVEIRRYFHAPGVSTASGGVAAVAAASPSSSTTTLAVPSAHPTDTNPGNTFMWNDRDCNATNYFLCERPPQLLPHGVRTTSDSDDDVAAAAAAADASSLLSPDVLRAAADRVSGDGTLLSAGSSTCNRTVTLTRERQRAHIWSPSYPFEYPDNVNCYTLVVAPDGYSVVLEFEEFLLEPEPECTYDYLEIVDTLVKGKGGGGGGARRENGQQQRQQQQSDRRSSQSNEVWPPPDETVRPPLGTAHNPFRSLYQKYLSKPQRFQRSLPAKLPSMPPPSSPAANQTAYEQFMLAYAALQRRTTGGHSATVVLRIPTPAEQPASAMATDEFRAAKQRPHRVCGDWNAKLKLLRYTSAGPQLGLRFSSDYSHHRSGFKARVMLKNASSTCADDRLVAHAGHCYLFVSYPEVDWSTARSVCRGIGAHLASVRTVDEQRFIVDNIRHQMDYTTHTIYWLGGEQLPATASATATPLSHTSTPAAGAFRWSDGQNMSYVGWLPGDELVAAAATAGRPGNRSAAASLCIALRWKLSPTPMLPSSIYWSAERCTKYGGYVCKSRPPPSASGPVAAGAPASPPMPAINPSSNAPVTTSGEYHARHVNRTVEGREGRLTSPGYPNTYPPNTDYWVRLRGPPNTRLVVQFQLIDLEPQEDCLYDYVSVQEARADQPMASESAPTSASTMAAAGDDYSRTDLTAKRWYRNDLQRIARMRRDLRGQYGGTAATSALLLGHEIGVLRRFRDSMRRVTDALTVQSLSSRRRRRSVAQQPPISGANDDASAARAHPPTFAPYVRWCGAHSTNMTRFDFVSASNAALVHFHSDYSLAAMGFAAVWSAIDITGCPAQTLTAAEGRLQSPNFPHFLLNGLECEFEIYAGRGRRVWLEFEEFEVLQDGLVEVDVGDGAAVGVVVPFRHERRTMGGAGGSAGYGEQHWMMGETGPDNGMGEEQQQQQQPQHLNDGIYVSKANRMVVKLRTGSFPRGRGFRAVYRTVAHIAETHRIALPDTAYGHLYHLNHPLPMPDRINYTQHLVAPVGYVVFLEFFGVRFSDQPCSAGNSTNGTATTAGSLEVFDSYADVNGTGWTLCAAQPTNGASSAAPVHITSYLNTLHVRQLSGSVVTATAVHLNASVRVIADLQYKRKLAAGGDTVETCQPNPCRAGGRCVSAPASGNRCVCAGHFTGRFCALTACEMEPCMYGKCQLTATGFKCVCQDGYVGRTCERKQPPCAQNPCEGRGECFNRASGFFCRCHAWWEGVRCERRMQNIPYKPLSDRMLQEPFWLGLITVFVVLAFIGLVWCAKRHFPEKIEKLLTEEAERNRPPGMLGGHHHHHHHQSLREQLQFTTTTTSSATHSNVTTPGAARTIFSRFGIRKPSIVSVSSTPQPVVHTGAGSVTGDDASAAAATARTFSLDDLLRPPPRRTPSPRKKRNNSTPTKTVNAAEKKQILQQLIGPARPGIEKIALNDLISIEACGGGGGAGGIRETTLSESPEILELANDAKLEKKVTFARLLNKVSAEMSSGSDSTHTGGGGSGSGGVLGLPDNAGHRRTSSMPPSPCDLDAVASTSHHHGGRLLCVSGGGSTSTQSSDSMSSSELMLAPTTIVDQHQQPAHQRYGSVGSATMNLCPPPLSSNRALRPKVSSADSLLTMFRHFAGGGTRTQPNAAASSERSALSPSSSLATSSSPHDDLAAGDDDSSTSSLHTPVSFNSLSNGIAGSGPTFEVSAVDLLKAAENAAAAMATTAAAEAAQHVAVHAPSGGYLLTTDGIQLDLPANINQCLSPIRELPTPMPSPAPTPVMMRQHSFAARFGRGGMTGRTGEGADEEEEGDEQLRIEQNYAGISFKSFITKQPSLDTGTDPPPNTGHQPLAVPSIHISLDADCAGGFGDDDYAASGAARRVPAVRPTQLIIPKLVVEQSSPVAERLPVMFLGSPPPQRQSVGETNFYTGNGARKTLKSMDKPSSLDLLCMPPTITITPNRPSHHHNHHHHNPNHTDTTTTISDSSDADLNHPGGGGRGCSTGTTGRQLHLLKVPTIGMTYLSPFSMCSRGDRTISESNLSSSGYSSMASPGPSRCGSNNPLLPGELGGGGGGGGAGGAGDDSSGPPSGGSIASTASAGLAFARLTAASGGPSSMAGGGGTSGGAAAQANAASGAAGGVGGGVGHMMMHLGPSGKLQLARRARLCSDSETMSDDVVLESNDEGIEMDHGNGSGGAEETPEHVEGAGAGGGLLNVAVGQKPQQLRVDVGAKTTAAAVTLDVAAKKESVMEPIVLSLVQEATKGAMSSASGGNCGGGGGGGGSDVANWVGAHQLQLPMITLQPCEADGERVVAASPMSSRSESPMSERLPDTKRCFSALFYDSKEQQLPFTDSDGLYDFPSSDGRRSAEPHAHRRSSSSKRRGDRKASRSPSAQTVNTQSQSGSKQLRGQQQQQQQHLHVNSAASTSLQSFGQQQQQQAPRRSPTKRRSMAATHRQRPPAEMSSSSSESIVPRRTPTDRSTADLLATHLLAAINPNSPLLQLGSHSADEQLTNACGGGSGGAGSGAGGSDMQLFPAGSNDTTELVDRPNKAVVRSNRRINRLRAIGNQLKFLRRFDRSKPAADNHPQTAPKPDTLLSTLAAACTADPNDDHNKTPPRVNESSTKDATDGDDDDDDDDDEISFVTSPLLIQQQQQPPPSRPSTSSMATAKVGPLWRPRDSADTDGDGGGAEEAAAFVAPAKRPTSIYGGARRPWRSRNRRFVYDGGNINSD